jgi:hypothetical protein
MTRILYKREAMKMKTHIHAERYSLPTFSKQGTDNKIDGFQFGDLSYIMTSVSNNGHIIGFLKDFSA